jgi:signal transduction histidine kinase
MSSRKKAQIIFGTAVALLLLSGGAAYVTIARLLYAQNWVRHTNQVQDVLGEANTATAKAERFRINYIQSGDFHYLEQHDAILAEFSQQIALARKLTTDNPIQQDNCSRLEELNSRRAALTGPFRTGAKSNSADLQTSLQNNQRIADVDSQIDVLIQNMQNEELQLLDQRATSERVLFRETVSILIVTFLVALAILFIYYALLNAELGARRQAEDSLRALSGRLINLQDEERRRFSRELHDSLGQYLAAAKMNLTMLSRKLPEHPALLECIELLDKCISETRTISHLMHPPLLEEVGLASAIEWYVEGFSKRSGVQTKLDLPRDLARLPQPLELALFRVIQESLINIHRHAQTARAEIDVKISPDQVAVHVRDYGKGMRKDALEQFNENGSSTGVGLAGMRERLHELGGLLEIHSDHKGTQISVTVPR